MPDLRARQVASDVLEILLHSATPNFKTYLIRVNGDSWKSIFGDRATWSLQSGENRFEVRTQNLAGMEGPVVSALVEFRQVSGCR